MQDVYGPGPHACVTETICFESYFKKFRSLLLPYDVHESNVPLNSTILDFMKVPLSPEELKIVANVCSIENLRDPNQPAAVDVRLIKTRPALYDRGTIPTCALKLESLKTLKRRLMCEEAVVILKYRSSIWPNEGPVEMLKTDLKPGNHILYTVRVYHPFIHKVGVRNAVLPRCSQEIVLLGSQTLDVLRDKVVCPCDLAVPGELSENPDKEFTARAKDLYKSGFIFIEDTFYNDFRDPANIDYSRVIQDWASDHNIGPFNTALMERTRFEDLKMKLGYPYVYQHQGKCEHLLVFSNVRLLHSCDKLLSMLYPSLRSMSSSNSQYCIICGIYTARWVTFENDRVPHDPSYFCDSCFRSYNYIDGKKIGKFKAYPFFGKP